MIHLCAAWVDKIPSYGCKISLLGHGYNQFLLSAIPDLERVGGVTLCGCAGSGNENPSEASSQYFFQVAFLPHKRPLDPHLTTSSRSHSTFWE